MITRTTEESLRLARFAVHTQYVDSLCLTAEPPAPLPGTEEHFFTLLERRGMHPDYAKHLKAIAEAAEKYPGLASYIRTAQAGSIDAWLRWDGDDSTKPTGEHLSQSQSRGI